MGVYGFVRLAIPLFPDAAAVLEGVSNVLAAIALVGGAGP